MSNISEFERTKPTEAHALIEASIRRYSEIINELGDDRSKVMSTISFDEITLRMEVYVEFRRKLEDIRRLLTLDGK
jgi:Mg2+ and Co2+ transporter CorA